MLLQVILALIPIAWLIIGMAVLKMNGVQACGIGLIITLVECVAVYGQSVGEVALGTAEGALAAIWPICIIIVAAMFTYNMSLRTGGMDVIKNMLASVSNDKRVTALLLGWCFSNFMEGIAGFGTAVAIPAAMMVGLGFDPISAAVICLIGNAASPAFGAIGTPTLSAATTAGLDAGVISQPTALLLIPLCIVSPFVIIMLTGSGMKAMKGMVPITLASAVTFTIPFYAVAAAVGPELCVTIGALVSLVVVVVMGKGMKGEIPEEYKLSKDGDVKAEAGEQKMSVVKAWLPYILIVVFLLAASKLCPPINQTLGAIKTATSVTVGDVTASFAFSWINTPGVLIIVAGIIGSLVQGASVGDLGSEIINTFKGYWKAMLTVIFIVAIAKLMNHAGMVTSLANGLVALTGNFYMLICPIIGGIGCFVTGSATSACVMFASMQNQIGAQLGTEALSHWLVAANSAGATAGKMISPQSIAVAVAAVSASGSDGKIMSATIKWCGLYLVILCIFCFVGAQIFI